jgi:AcrR family transcriptional regulator
VSTSAERTSDRAAAEADGLTVPGGERDAAARNLRDAHQQLTRELIMRSVVERLERGDAPEITVPDIAKAAGVSVRTVYRRFPTRNELIAAASEWVVAHYWGDRSLPEDVDQLAAHFARQAKAFDHHPNLMRALAISRAGKQVTSVRRAQRLEKQNLALRKVTGNLPAAEQRRAEAVFGYLSNLLAWLTMRDENGFSGEESGAAVSWAIQVLIDDLCQRNQTAAADKAKPRPEPSEHQLGG